MAQILEIDPDAVVGKLLRVWAWFDEQTENGNASSVTKALLDRKVGVTGFVTAMLQVGWLVETEHGLSVPNFDRHNGHTAKKRVLTAKRVAESRANSGDVTLMKQECNAASVTSALAREEKRREEKNINTIPPKSPKGKSGKFDPFSFPLPENLNTPEVRAVWREFVQHRIDKRSRPTEAACRQVVKKYSDTTPARFCEILEHCILNNWTGVFEPSGSTQASSKNSDADPFEKFKQELLAEETHRNERNRAS